MAEDETVGEEVGAARRGVGRLRSCLFFGVLFPFCLVLIFLVVQVFFNPRLLYDGSAWEQMFTGEPGVHEMLALFETIDEDFDAVALDGEFEERYPNLVRTDATVEDDGYVVIVTETMFAIEDFWALTIEFDDGKIQRAGIRHVDHESIQIPRAPADKVFAAE